MIGRNVRVEKRSWAMGVAAAAGSFGQFLMVPTEGLLIAHLGWDQALMVLSVALLLILPASWFMREPALAAGAATRRDHLRASGHQSFHQSRLKALQINLL